MAYDIDEVIATGDTDHVGHHVALAQAVNDLDARVDATIPKYVYLADEPETTDPNTTELYVGGILRGYLNEWRALRGRNPYTTFADALVRAIVGNGDNTAGNAFELVDRRTGAPTTVLWGVNWGNGRMTQGGQNV